MLIIHYILYETNIIIIIICNDVGCSTSINVYQSSIYQLAFPSCNINAFIFDASNSVEVKMGEFTRA